ncbi:hypothetical protein [Tunicatimonas pelagia]|uniref:hypothetical protein n=1 Tax=Tunicatimonas pelagia TaxID=931531 RepID=UPI0026659790|nr:hypothetical protein [Tunicatimonas pelagia]WKN42885.1 hypothetical protein P0M28_28000 [Tunicatimonas pelagia]
MSRKITKNTLSFILLLTLIGFFQVAEAQERGAYNYSREYIWGISKNTNSGLIAGVAGKFSRVIGENQFQSFGLEIVNVKHPKELRRVSRVSGNTFLLGKTNYLFSVRPQYGREWVVFKKAPQQGVQVNAILAGGPTIGILMPYYIQFAEGNQVTTVPYDPIEHGNTGNIVGSGPFLRGIGESQLKVGANIKASLAFEFGTFKNDVTGFEAGFQLEAFTERIELVPLANNRQIFPSAFIMLFYGGRK